MTRETIEKLPENVRREIEQIRADYNRRKQDKYYSTATFAEAAGYRSGYLKALRDAGIITEQERKIIHVYTTV